jgi:hypothetical protein
VAAQRRPDDGLEREKNGFLTGQLDTNLQAFIQLM